VLDAGADQITSSSPARLIEVVDQLRFDRSAPAR
jgi:hypothetical protein